ncbi:MAG: rhomboid family intramembrane serine protease [Pirellulaceae bacterium]|nr:rhomboid family intramembrane serine protease [Pirellulaceae bacterium]
MRIYPQNDLPPEPPYGDAAPLEYSGAPLRRVADFQRLLFELTPRIFVTPVLIGVNVIVFVLMTVFGVSPFSPAMADLLRWGADFGPLTLDGEWWRLLTSMFLHIGIIHIGLNMWVLYAAGPLVERMLGNSGFLLMYLVAGLCGGLASLAWNPVIVSAGASGGIFGIYGCLLGMVVRGRGSIPPEILTQLRSSGLGFLFYNLIFGMMMPNIDMAAHLGGLAGGFLCGLILSQPYTASTRAGRLPRNLLLAGLGTCLVAGGFMGVSTWHSGLVRVQRELTQFGEVEEKSIEAFNAAVRKSQRKELSGQEFADLLERDVLPEWRAARERLSAVQRVPASHQRRVELTLEYMLRWQEAWELFAQEYREDSPDKMRKAMERQQLAESAVQLLNKEAGK